MKCFLCFIFIIALSFAQDLDCTWTDPTGKYYDLSKLKNTATDYYIPSNTYPSQDWDIWINVCHSLVNTLCGNDAIACQQWDKNSPQGHASMGTANTQAFESLKTGVGVVLQYVNGPDNRQTEIDFICDATAGVGTPKYVTENPQHHYTFSWSSQYACPISKGGISPGTILIIIVICLIVVYLVAGIIFNKFKRGLTGIEIIPNVTFWTSIPGLVKDGVMFIVNKVRNRGGYTKL